ncbi:hypothetical protein U0070_011642 [Myodes glareolus]|uniref:C2H2-type domain-containing protein n=1 Tax=Myodes glareolus TaxID=447135 RepID=A0AAW0HEI9_MYOGA
MCVLYKVMKEPYWKKPYECNQCGKAFACHSHLQSMSKHILERNIMYVISIVKTLFIIGIFKDELTHAEEKPYECNHCGKDFVIHSTLQMQKKKSHTGDKLYDCNQWGKAFACMNNLNNEKKSYCR